MPSDGKEDIKESHGGVPDNLGGEYAEEDAIYECEKSLKKFIF